MLGLKAFFSALASLTANANALAASFAEANARFRDNLALDHTEEVPALPGPTADDKPARNGRTRTKAHA